MRLYPAIDIKDGQCVRLKKGLFNEVTVYSDKPYEIAKSFEADGAKFIHTVDLDGARGGRGRRRPFREGRERCAKSKRRAIGQSFRRE